MPRRMMVAITDASGSLVSQQRYLPFGQVRSDTPPIPNSPITETDLSYTGQRAPAELQLQDYKARFYDDYITHFTQPDSIIPDLNNPQSWDRYSYALNNPIRYNDPSGHNYCDHLNKNNSEDCKPVRSTRKINDLINYVRKDIVNDDWQVKQKYTALEAMNLIVKKAASIYGQDWNGFLKATNYIFLGTYSNTPYTMPIAHNTEGFHGITFSSGAGDTGFNPDFTQMGDNQVRHYWAAFATAANGRRGELTAEYGNFYHDMIEDWLGHKDTTYSDYTLSLTAINTGIDVNTGSISSPSQLPEVFDNTIGLSSPGYTGQDLRWLFITPDQ